MSGSSGGDRDVAIRQRRRVGGLLLRRCAPPARRKTISLPESGVRNVVLMEAGRGLRDHADAPRLAGDSRGMLTFITSPTCSGKQLPEHGDPVFGRRVEVGLVLGGHAHGHRRDPQEGGFHGRRHGPGIVDVDADVGPVVDARDRPDRSARRGAACWPAFTQSAGEPWTPKPVNRSSICTFVQASGSAKVMLWLAPDQLSVGATTVTSPNSTSRL